MDKSEHGHSQQALRQQQQDLEHSHQLYQQAMEDISATTHPLEIETSQWQLPIPSGSNSNHTSNSSSYSHGSGVARRQTRSSPPRAH